MNGARGDSQNERKPLYRLTRGTRFACSNVHNMDGGKGRAGIQSRIPWAQPGERVVLAEIEGPAVIQRLWLTFDWVDRYHCQGAMLRNRAIRLEITWDGAATPAVSVPVGDFFGHPLGYDIPFENAWFADPVGRSFLCFLPMPFRQRAEVAVVNDFDRPVAVFHDIRFTQAIVPDPDDGYFHACFNRTIPETPDSVHPILARVKGRGRFLGTHMGLITDRFNPLHWHGGMVKFFLDGDREHPSMLGASLDDYAGSAWLYEQRFMHQDSGLLLSRKLMEGGGHYGMYVYHRRDPLVFETSCEVSIQAASYMTGSDWLRWIEQHPGLTARMSVPYPVEVIKKAVRQGHDLDFLAGRMDDLSTVAMYYLDRPEGCHPPCPQTTQCAPAWQWPNDDGHVET